MKIKTLHDGNDGERHLPAGTIYDKDNEWARRMLVNGMAEPLDAETRKIVEDKEQQVRYGNDAMRASARESAKVEQKKK